MSCRSILTVFFISNYYASVFFAFLTTKIILRIFLPTSTSYGIEPKTLTYFNDPVYSYAQVTEIVASGLLLLEHLIDNLSSKSMGIDLGYFYVMFSILMTVLLSSAIILFYAIPYDDFLTVSTIVHIRNMAFFCGACVFNMYFGEGIWKEWQMKTAFFLGCLGFVLRGISSGYQIFYANINKQIETFGIILQVIASLSFIVYTIRWIRFLWITSKSRRLTKNEFSCAVMAVLWSCCIVTLWAGNRLFGNPEIEDYNLGNLLTNSLGLLVWVVILTLYQTRLERRESKRYQEELEFKRMFVRYISHEVRTPLNTAIMGLQLLKEDMCNLGDREHIDTVHDVTISCDIAVNVLNELLTFDKLEGGSLMLEKKDVRAVHLIEETVNSFQIQARAGGVDLKLVVESEGRDRIQLLTLFVDGNKIAQVIRNLVSNGLKFTPRGGTVTVRVSIVDDLINNRLQKALKIEVTDSGAGISPSNQLKLFKEIVQFHPGRLQRGGGSGLGLYISNGIAALHGGQLSVWSAGEGEGSTFTLRLPIDMESMITSAGSPSLSTIYEVDQREIGRVNDLWRSLSNSDDDVEAEGDELYTVAKKYPGASLFNQETLSRVFQPTPPIAPWEEDERSIGMSAQESSDRAKRNESISPIHKGASSRSFDFEAERDPNKNESSTKKNEISAMTVLVVDDSELSRKMQCRLLRRRFRSCIEAENGLEAFMKVQEVMLTDSAVEIDLIVMDSEMPGMDGSEATKKMREIGYKGGIIGLTGNVSEDDVKLFLDHGANAVLSKPLNIESFELAVRQLFN